MNNNSKQPNGQEKLNLKQLANFIKTQDPNKAKSQIENMLANGQLDKQKFNMLKERAEQLGAFLGVK